MSADSNNGAAKLKAIRALWVTAHNQTGDLEGIAAEFFFALGDLLEGHPPEELNLRNIDAQSFMKELRDD